MSSNLAKILADFNTQMATKNAVGDTTGTLQGYTDDDGVALPTSVKYYLTVDGDNSQKEYIQATLGATGALTAIKSVSRQGVLTSGFARVHRVGALVEITDFAHIKMMLDLLDATTGLDSSNPIKYDGSFTPTLLQYHVPTWDYVKAYVDGVTTAGAPDAATTTKGITKLSVAPVSATIPIAVGDNDPRVPTQSENDAQVGTSGAPSSSNKYVTDDDASTGYDQIQSTQNASRAVGEADATTKNNKLGQSLVAGKTGFAGVRLYKAADTGSFTGTVTVSLQADSAGSPSGTPLATVTLSNAAWLALPTGLFHAIFGSAYAASIGTTYWIVIETSTSDNSNHPNIGTNSAGGYASGGVKFKNVTDGWTAVSTIDLYFAVLTTIAGKLDRLDSNGFSKGFIPAATDSGGDDTYSVDLPGVTALVTNMTFLVNFATANTGPATLNVSSLGAKSLLRPDGSALVTGDVVAGKPTLVGYDGTQFIIMSSMLAKYAISGSTSQYTDSAEVSATSSISKSFTVLMPGTITVEFESKVSVDDGTDAALLSLSEYDVSTPKITVTSAANALTAAYQTFSVQKFLTPGKYTLTVTNSNSRTVYLKNLALKFDVANMATPFVI